MCTSAMVNTAVPTPIMQMIHAIQEEYPDIRFHFFSGNTDAITERLNKGLLDMVFSEAGNQSTI